MTHFIPTVDLFGEWERTQYAWDLREQLTVKRLADGVQKKVSEGELLAYLSESQRAESEQRDSSLRSE